MTFPASSMNFSLPRLYAIINASGGGGRPPSEVGAELLDAGVRWIQFRSKLACAREVYTQGLQLAGLVQSAGGVLIINDRADIGRAVEANGVHVGQDDLHVEMARRVVGPDKIVGVSTHSLEQVREADQSSADYIAFGPIFPTQTKQHPDAVVGLDGLRAARGVTRKPLAAIGGITLERAEMVLEAGADLVAVIGDLLNGPSIGGRAREYLKALENFESHDSKL
jgi:thiamine-phosphate pyrophosphorylase